MPSAGNFHPEWGYLAPAPNFMRTARIVAVATAIGATAGAAVVLSLADRPVSSMVADTGKTLVVVHSLVQPAEAAAPSAEPVGVAATTLPAPMKVQATATPAPAPSAPANLPASASSPAPTRQAAAKISAPAPSEVRAMSTSASPQSVTALAESPPATDGAAPVADAAINDAAVAPVTPVAGPKATKKIPAAGQQTQRSSWPPIAAPKKKTAHNDGLGPILRRLFSAN